MIVEPGERKFAAALFADLSGYTALCQRLDPEEVEATIRPVMTALRQAAIDEGGRIVSRAGDGFFAVFGVPIAFPDAPHRAVRSAAAMCELVQARNAMVAAERIPDVHVGIAVGEVLVTPSDEPGGMSLVGQSVNLASRLCDAAAAGEILADEETKRLVAGATAWQASRRLRLRGHVEEVTAWLLASGPDDRPLTTAETPFVGRAATLDLLDDAFAGVCAQGRSAVRYLGGEAGIGKTRTVAEWLRHTSADLQIWLSCDRAVGSPSLSDLITMIPGAQLPEADSGSARRLDDVGATLRTDPFPELLSALRGALVHAAGGTPVVVVVDDLHVADPSVASAVADIDRHPLDAPVLLLCTERTGELAHERQGRIELDRLTAAQADEIVAAVIGVPPSRELLAAVADRVEGHPLMAVQLAAYLVEAEVVTTADGRGTVADLRAVQAMPSSVRMFITARIDQLPASQKALLQQLSVFGEVIDPTLATTVLGRAAMTELGGLVRRGLVQQGAASMVSFGHKLIQEAAYQSLTRGNRADLHQRVLRVAEVDGSALRCYHALGWAENIVTTDRQATDLAARAALVETFGHAEFLYRTQSESTHALIARAGHLITDRAAASPPTAVRLLALDAHCLVDLGRFEAAIHAAEQASAIAVGHGLADASAVSAQLARGRALSRLRRFESARQILDAAAADAVAIGDRSAQAHALWLIGETWRDALFTRFTSLTERAHFLFIEAGDDAGAAETARLLAYLFSAAAPVLYDRWLGAARRFTGEEDLRGQVWLRRAEAIAHAARLEHDACAGAARELVALGRQLGSTDAVAEALMNLAQCEVARGEVDQAVLAAQQFVEVSTRELNLRMRMVAAATAVLPYLRSGQLRLAVEELEYATRAAPEFGAKEVDDATVARACYLRDVGAFEDGIALFSANATAVAAGSFGFYALTDRAEHLRLACVLSPADAIAALETLAAACREADAPVLRSYVESLTGWARAAVGDDSPVEAPVAGSCLEEAAIRADSAAIWAERRGDQPPAAWAAARDVWHRLGYTIWLARAQARSGDAPAARQTLDVLGSPEAARAWALGE